ncbi:MAG: MarR family transcriptional regulator [Propionibacteriales bacterium]|nr:MarR family transcriptional regulator [Propionibacteriales bacterium]
MTDGFEFPFPLSTLLGRVQAVFAIEYDRRIAELGIEGLSLALGTNVLRHLHGAEGVRLSRLVDLSGVTKQAISQQVAHLEAHGYVVVEPDPADSRAKLVRLTDKGRWSQDTARPVFADLEADWQKRFGRTEIRDLRLLLEGILTELGDTNLAPRTRRAGRRQGP